MRSGIDNVEGKKGRGLVMDIIRLKDEFYFTYGREAEYIEMSFGTFVKIRKFADDYDYLLCRYNEFTRAMDYKLLGMYVIFVDDMEGVEVY